MLKSYDDLLDSLHTIERAWSEQDNRYEAFAAVVMRYTTGLDLSVFSELGNTPELLSQAPIAALQHPSTFSDLYFKLFDNGHFWVEVLNWWGSDINVHDHNFTGVQFQLRGRSLNVVYRYHIHQVLADLTLGHLEVARAELWRPGSRSIVRSGAAEPHHVSHLDIPTVSLLIRTHPQPACGVQNNYLTPDVSGNYGIADRVFRKKIAALRLLARGPRCEFHRVMRATLAQQTHAQNLFTWLKLLDIVFHAEHAELLLEYAQGGALQQRLLRAVAYHRAQHYLTNTIKYVAGLTSKQKLLVSVLAAAFDQDSFEAILSSLATSETPLDVARGVAEIQTRLTGEQRRQFDDILRLYQLDFMCLVR